MPHPPAPIRRRAFLPLVGAALAAPALLARPARAAAAAPATPAQLAAWESPRTLGHPDAKIVVEEYFSLTCTHCANFAGTTFAEIQTKLIDTGKIRWVFRDFPLDKVALGAAGVARALPPERYAAFVLALFADQDGWAFGAGEHWPDALWKMAALAGLDRATYDTAVADPALQHWILTAQTAAEKKWKIDATPSFVINGRMVAGEMPYADFVKELPGLG